MRNALLAFTLLLVIVVPSVSFASQGNVPGLQFGFNNPLCPNGGSGCPNDLISFFKKLLDFVTLLATPIIVLMLIYVGFKFIAAQGNADKLADARKFLLWTLVGAGIILGAEAILMAIQGTVAQIRGATGFIDLIRHLV